VVLTVAAIMTVTYDGLNYFVACSSYS